MSNLLPANEHVIDRAVRVVLGLGLLVPIGLSGVSIGTIVSGAIGGVLLFTAAVGSCPIYTALGLSTKPK